MDLARERGVPDYVVFYVRSLVEMARELPANKAEFAQIPGVGEAKLKKLRPAFPGPDGRIPG